jgi:hypothetical protein
MPRDVDILPDLEPISGETPERLLARKVEVALMFTRRDILDIKNSREKESNDRTWLKRLFIGQGLVSICAIITGLSIWWFQGCATRQIQRDVSGVDYNVGQIEQLSRQMKTEIENLQRVSSETKEQVRVASEAAAEARAAAKRLESKLPESPIGASRQRGRKIPAQVVRPPDPDPPIVHVPETEPWWKFWKRREGP